MFIASWGPYWIKRNGELNNYEGLIYIPNEASSNILAVDIVNNPVVSIVGYDEIIPIGGGSFSFDYQSASQSSPAYSFSDDIVYIEGVVLDLEGNTSTRIVKWDPRKRITLEEFAIVDPQNQQYTKISAATDNYLWCSTSTYGTTPVLKRYNRTTKNYVDTIDGTAIVQPGEAGPWGLFPLTDTLAIFSTYMWNQKVPRIYIIEYTNSQWSIRHTVNLPSAVGLPKGTEVGVYLPLPYFFGYSPITNELVLSCEDSGVGSECGIVINTTTGITTFLYAPVNERWDGWTFYIDRNTGKKFLHSDMYTTRWESACVEYDENNQIVGFHGRETGYLSYMWQGFIWTGEYIVGIPNNDYGGALFKVGQPSKIPVGYLSLIIYTAGGTPYPNEAVQGGYFGLFFWVPPAQRTPTTPTLNKTVPYVVDAFVMGDNAYQFYGPYTISNEIITSPIMWFEVNYTATHGGYKLSPSLYNSSTYPAQGTTDGRVALYDSDGNLRQSGGDGYITFDGTITPPGKYYIAYFYNTEPIFPPQREFVRGGLLHPLSNHLFLFARLN